MARIAVRREDKSRFERRVPLVPDDVSDLVQRQGVQLTVQPSEIRAFPDVAFREAGAEINEDLSGCDVVFGVKEIPESVFEPGKAYVFFSHTIKAQPYNMPMLRRIMERGCTLIDYERITDEAGWRTVFFGPFAGLAGMIDTLWTLGRRLKHQGIDSPFTAVRQALEYHDLAHARREIRKVGEAILGDGLPPEIEPLVVGFAGYGNVSRGAQEIYNLLGVQELKPEDLVSLPADAKGCYKVVYREEHLVERIDASRPFELQEYYQQPEKYRAAFRPQLEHLTALVNCIYWEPKYPRLVTRQDLTGLFESGQPPKLRVIGDITCDIEGSIEATVRATDPGDPVYTYDPATGETPNGVEGPGVAIVANDILPCELPVDASHYFSAALRGFIPQIAEADLTKPLAQTGLPAALQRATIVHQGKLTEPYRYLGEHVK